MKAPAMFFGLAALSLAMAASTPEYQQDDSAPTACETDSDCLLHCPPPADDPDCDGGPQS